MTERIKVSSVNNPEYSFIRDYVEEALIEEQDGRPLGKSLKRAAGFMARYIAIFSSLVPSEQGRELVDLDQVVLRSRGSRDKSAALRYSVRVERKAKELLPGWMEVRQVVEASSHDETDIAEQEQRQLRRVGADMLRDNA